MEKVIVCDIDGCLVNTSWIWDIVKKLEIKDEAMLWDFFDRNANAEYNQVDETLVNFLKRQRKEGFKIIFLTARSCRIGRETIALIENKTGLKLNEDFTISCRGILDKEPAPVSKLNRLEKISKDKKILCFIDDDDKNCEVFTECAKPVIKWNFGAPPTAYNKIAEHILPLFSGGDHAGNWNICPSIEYPGMIQVNRKKSIEDLPAYLTGDELTDLFSSVINEMNRRKEGDERGEKPFNLGLTDVKGRFIYTGDVLKTPEKRYCTAILSDKRPAVLSPGSNAIDYEDEKFFNSCRVVGNIKQTPNFYEKLVDENGKIGNPDFIKTSAGQNAFNRLRAAISGGLF